MVCRCCAHDACIQIKCNVPEIKWLFQGVGARYKFSHLRHHDAIMANVTSIDPSLTMIPGANSGNGHNVPGVLAGNCVPPMGPVKPANGRKTTPSTRPSKSHKPKKRKAKVAFANIFMPKRPQSLASKWTKAKQAAKDEGRPTRRHRPGSTCPYSLHLF
jgi:hypothetical protein